MLSEQTGFEEYLINHTQVKEGPKTNIFTVFLFFLGFCFSYNQFSQLNFVRSEAISSAVQKKAVKSPYRITLIK